ncbi:MAG TPA: Stp1/IreP family PP2C-type Ser/Thr phosphatase [Roseiflexaceae bacterium]|nr:Stp1/IreP family PP2C-type Ser/Thr phosphatase [Roseiflexaceae bacterium]
MSATCPSCRSPVLARSRYCAACGRALPHRPPTAALASRTPPPAQPGPSRDGPTPLEVALPSVKQVQVRGDTLDLAELLNVVESGVRWWQSRLTGADAVTRERAAREIEELSKILHSLSQQVAQGRRTVRITTRLPALRAFDVACPACGAGNREGARFCQRCGQRLPAGTPQGAQGGPMPLRLSTAARTDQGRVRKNNQDSVFTGMVSLPGGAHAHLCLVADGMGGARAGEQASQIAAEVTRAQIQREAGSQQPPDDAAWRDILRQATLAANRRVYEEARADKSRDGMGTTLTVALIVGDRLHLASVGDSRAYLFNLGGVTDDGALAAQLTSDHSLVARLVDIGQITPEQARVHPQRNVLYRTIGTDPSVPVDTRSEHLEPGDVVLLCSDGLFNHVHDEEIAQIVLQQPDVARAADQLVALANERGGRDNISVVIVRVERG